MANSAFCFVQSNTRPFFAVQMLRSNDHSVVDLSSATVTFYFRHTDNRVAEVNGGNCNITDAPNGKVEYRWLTGDLNTPGLHIAEFRITFGDGTIQSVIIEDVNVAEKLG